MFGLIKKVFIVLLTGLVNGSNHKNSISLGNQKSKVQPTVINLHPNKYSQKFHYYLFAVKFDVLEVVTVWMTYLVKYAFQIK